jgi:hypothetical protein
MSTMGAAAKDLDLSLLPPEHRVAFEALHATAVQPAELEDSVKRLEHLVAELNHVIHVIQYNEACHKRPDARVFLSRPDCRLHPIPLPPTVRTSILSSGSGPSRTSM